MEQRLQKLAAVVNVDEDANNEFRAGYKTLLNALNAPLRQIAANAGEREAAVVLNTVVEGKGKNFGYNALEDRYEDDMVKSGIIDPLKVTRTAIENAVSVASMLLTTEAVITDKPVENDGGIDAAAAAAAMGGMGGGMPGMM